MTKQNRIYLLFLVLYFIIGCSQSRINEERKKFNEQVNIDEAKVKIIPLGGEIAKRSSEISGLSWYGDNLILLPQYPDNFDNNFGKIFYINKNRIEKSLASIDNDPILPDYYLIDLAELKEFFNWGSGFEAITIKGNIVYFCIEYMNSGLTETILVLGEIDQQNKKITIDKNSLTKNPANLFIHNISDESILYYNNVIIPIYEINGKNLNKNSFVSVFDDQLKFLKKIPFPTIEYRITDVTTVDEEGKFWAINYFFPGDKKKIKPAEDLLVKKFGMGKTHSFYEPVERLVEFKIDEESIIMSDKAPIYLELLPNESRNWEGIVRFNEGFLLVTDRYPETILAYVEFNR